MTSGEWHTIEMRIKLNDAGESNGEFMFFFDGELTNHLTDIANMAGDDYVFTHARWWVMNKSPGATNDQSIYFKNYYVTLFSSDTTPNIYSTEAPTEPPTTTHPITTSAPGLILEYIFVYPKITQMVSQNLIFKVNIIDFYIYSKKSIS